MPAWLAATGEQAAGAAGATAANGILGLLLGGVNDRRQVRQQKRLNEANKPYVEWLNQQQLKMWEATGYGAQKDQLKRAGMNPALMYGMGGGGGQSSNIQATAPGAAPTGGGEAMGMIGMGLNMALLRAQKENIEADTAKKDAEAAEIKGIKTAKGQQEIVESQSRTELNLQGLDNARQENEIQRLKQTMMNLENFKMSKSMDDDLDRIHWEAAKAMRQYEILTNESYVSGKTREENVSIIQQRAIGAVLDNVLKRTENAQKQQQITESVNNVMRDWDKLSLEQKRVQIMDIMKDWETDLPKWGVEQATKILDDILRWEMHTPTVPKRNPIGYGK